MVSAAEGTRDAVAQGLFLRRKLAGDGGSLPETAATCNSGEKRFRHGGARPHRASRKRTAWLPPRSPTPPYSAFTRMNCTDIGGSVRVKLAAAGIVRVTGWTRSG